MHLIKLIDIAISPERQRKSFDEQALQDLASSIAAVGLIHPVVVRSEGKEVILVAGERRIRAMDLLWNLGDSFTHGGKHIPEGSVPCTFLKDLDPLDAMEIELEENIKREDLTWQDRSEATSQLYELRRLQAEKAGQSPPTVAQLGRQVYPDHHPDAATAAVKSEIILAKQLHDPEVAAAPSMQAALKIVKRKEEAQRNAELGERVGKTFSAQDHTLLRGECLEKMSSMPAYQFDCILTDPPYGIDAQTFNDSDGKAAGGHSYDDSYSNWLRLIRPFLHEAFRLAKSQAHLYCFCDVDNFIELRKLAAAAGWKPFRTPLIWHNPTSQRAPWPHMGPHRRWQMCLYAVKGDRPVLKLAPDMVTHASDENLGWAAQKPVALYQDLLSRTCRPGDSVLDPFCGSGTIFPAAHGVKVRATGIEMDATAFGISSQRLGALK